MVWICIAVLLAFLIAKKLNDYKAWWVYNVQRTQTSLYPVGYIYFFFGRKEPFWNIKIGRTNNLRARLSSHRTANPYGVHVISAFKTFNDVQAEQFLRKHFAVNRINPKNEWFRLSVDLILAMYLLRDGYLTREINQWLTNGTVSKSIIGTRRKNKSVRSASGGIAGKKPKNASAGSRSATRT